MRSEVERNDAEACEAAHEGAPPGAPGPEAHDDGRGEPYQSVQPEEMQRAAKRLLSDDRGQRGPGQRDGPCGPPISPRGRSTARVPVAGDDARLRVPE